MRKWVLLLGIISISVFEMKAQIHIGEDYASNYGEAWAGNGGYGFGNWNLYGSTGEGTNNGRFLQSSTTTHGNVNSSDNRAFGMQGTAGYHNAERTIATWGDQATFSLQMAVKWRDGQRGISLFNSTGFANDDQIWNFNINNDGYGSTEWAYSDDMVITVTVMQDGADVKINLSATGANGPYTSPTEVVVSGQTFGGFRLYVGDTGGDSNRDFYFNFLRVTVPSLSSVPSNARVRLASDATLDTDITVSQFDISSGATFTASDATARTITISKSTNGKSVTLSNNGTWEIGAGGSTVIFTGAPSGGDAVHSITGTIVFDNISVNKSGGESNIGADFQTGTSLTGSLKIGAGGYIESAPPASFYASSAILQFDQGSEANYDIQATDNSWSTTEVPQSITISSGTVTLQAARSVNTTVIVSSGATLVSNGNLTMANGSQLLNTGTVTGNVNFAREITGTAGWRMLSSPKSSFIVQDISDDTAIQGVADGSFPDAQSNFQYWGSNATWATPTNITTALTNGKGFITYFFNNSTEGSQPLPLTLTITGEPVAADVSVDFPTDAAEGNTDKTFALLGNPFSSNLDISQISATGGTLQTNARVWNNETNQYQSVALASGVVGPWTGFWIETSALPTSVSIPAAARTTTSASTPSKVENQKEIAFTLTSDSRSDASTRIVFSDEFSQNWDRHDASQLVPLLETYAAIGFVGDKLGTTVVKSIESLPETFTDVIEIPVQITSAGFDGELALSWSGLDELPQAWDIQLRDNQGNSTDLRSESSLNFYHKSMVAKSQNFSPQSPSVKAQEGSADFTLIISPAQLTSNENEELLPNRLALSQNYPNPFNPSTQIQFALPESMQVNVAVFDMNGRMIEQLVNSAMSAGNHTLTWNAAGQASGLYLLKLTAGNQTLTKKMSLIK